MLPWLAKPLGSLGVTCRMRRVGMRCRACGWLISETMWMATRQYQLEYLNKASGASSSHLRRFGEPPTHSPVSHSASCGSFVPSFRTCSYALLESLVIDAAVFSVLYSKVNSELAARSPVSWSCSAATASRTRMQESLRGQEAWVCNGWRSPSWWAHPWHRSSLVKGLDGTLVDMVLHAHA